jgi:hypothetical protein
METENLIAVNDFCISHNVELSFINTLHEKGLIEVITIDEVMFINSVHLQGLEKMVCFYYDLEINLEGIETINHLLQRINSMQDEIVILRNKLRFYE